MFGKRIVSLFLCFVITFSLFGVAFAEDYINRPVTFFDYLQRAVVNGTNDLPFGSVLIALGGLTFGQVCGVSGDAYHHTDSIKGATLGEDEHGQYANATCKYCNKPFKVYSSDLSAAYDDYVDDVKQETGTSTLINGGIRLYFKATAVSSSVSFTPGELFTVSFANRTYVDVSFANLVAPFDCNYVVGSRLFTFVNIAPLSLGSGSVSKGTSLFVNGSKLRLTPLVSNDTSFFQGSIYVDCVSPYQNVGSYYDIDLSNSTRPTVIIGDVGYYDASNNLHVINDTTIINETNNTFFNPITNITTNLTGWAYDYSDRSYTLTLDTGDKVSVTYGDEHITIIEGGTTYNVYYVYSSDDSGGGEDTDVSGFLDWWKQEWEDFRSWLATAFHIGTGSDCEHTYLSTVDRESTCTDPGLRTYTCTKCDHTYTELIDAFGHDWTVTGHVEEVLDEEGNVVEKGYDELTCSRCGAESKDYGDGPVESDIFDALGDLIADGITWILDRLTELADSLHGITDVFTSFAEKVQEMPGEYPLFFAAFVAIIPEDLSAVLWFSVIVFVVVAVWKKWSA